MIGQFKKGDLTKGHKSGNTYEILQGPTPSHGRPMYKVVVRKVGITGIAYGHYVGQEKLMPENSLILTEKKSKSHPLTEIFK